ncbi:MAG TPA: hypothetical protein VE398_22995 [Acidobacteriota bacterium]|nr:hypothetical protein [Acidobacteriota bacterium]
MGKINMIRVILGGLLAGLVINIGEFVLNMPILGSMWNDALKALNRPSLESQPPTFFILLSFALGLLTVYMYAAIRPRFGPGPLTAICAGLIVWSLASLYASAALLPINLFPRRLLLYACVWEFFEFPIAAMAGSWIYREEAQPA